MGNIEMKPNDNYLTICNMNGTGCPRRAVIGTISGCITEENSKPCSAQIVLPLELAKADSVE